MFTRNGTKIPHSLRLAILALRMLLGLNFFYVGFTTLFNPPLGIELSRKSMGEVYGWLHAPLTPLWLPAVSRWAFLIIGICLLIGFATRLASCVGIALTTMSFLPNITPPNVRLFQFANTELIIIACLIVLILSKAGRYIGLDAFFHFSLRHRK